MTSLSAHPPQAPPGCPERTTARRPRCRAQPGLTIVATSQRGFVGLVGGYRITQRRATFFAPLLCSLIGGRSSQSRRYPPTMPRTSSTRTSPRAKQGWRIAGEEKSFEGLLRGRGLGTQPPPHLRAFTGCSRSLGFLDTSVCVRIGHCDRKQEEREWGHVVAMSRDQLPAEQQPRPRSYTLRSTSTWRPGPRSTQRRGPGGGGYGEGGG